SSRRRQVRRAARLDSRLPRARRRCLRWVSGIARLGREVDCRRARQVRPPRVDPAGLDHVARERVECRRARRDTRARARSCVPLPRSRHAPNEHTAVRLGRRVALARTDVRLRADQRAIRGGDGDARLKPRATMLSMASELLNVEGRQVAISNPAKILFPEAGVTKLDLAHYYLAVADGALRGAGGRPNVLVRYPNGVGGEFFYQKRAPASRPEFIEVVALSFPSGRTAEEVVPRDAAALIWIANLACLELHPHPVRADDLDHPDELRVDLDPVPGVAWPDVRRVAGEVHAVLDEVGLVGWPKTSGSRGMHVYVRIERRWTFGEVRRAALAFAREVERRAPSLATSKWWKEERHGV